MSDTDLDEFVNDKPQSKFLKWDDGPFTLRFRLPDPLSSTKRHVHWINGKAEPCHGRNACSICPTIRGDDDQRKLKTSWVFPVEMDDGTERLLELSRPAKMVFAARLEEYRSRYGDDWRKEFSASWFEVRRRGIGKSIEYSIKPTKAPTKQAKSDDDDPIPF